MSVSAVEQAPNAVSTARIFTGDPASLVEVEPARARAYPVSRRAVTLGSSTDRGPAKFLSSGVLKPDIGPQSSPTTRSQDEMRPLRLNCERRSSSPYRDSLQPGSLAPVGTELVHLLVEFEIESQMAVMARAWSAEISFGQMGLQAFLCGLRHDIDDRAGQCAGVGWRIRSYTASAFEASPARRHLRCVRLRKMMSALRRLRGYWTLSFQHRLVNRSRRFLMGNRAKAAYTARPLRPGNVVAQHSDAVAQRDRRRRAA
jgi:hypothetical protein